MIVKTEEEKLQLRTAGTLLAEILAKTAALASPGITTAELDLFAEREIRARGAEPSFLGYAPADAPYAYPAALCVSINDEVVHGIPREDRALASGDIVSLDLGLSYNGYFVDSATTLCLGACDEDSKKLLRATDEALMSAIAVARAGGFLGDIGAAIERVAKREGLSIVEDLGGHAVGGAVHEKPFIANSGVEGKGEKVVEGMVLALEPMLTLGSPSIAVAEDGWTYVMEDGSRAAHFEHTILVTNSSAEILTKVS